VLKFFVQPVRFFCVVFQAANREIGPAIVQKNQRVFVVGWPFQSSLLCPQRCTPVDVACFPYCTSADWANVDILAMTHPRDWIAMHHKCPPFRTGRTIPFS